MNKLLKTIMILFVFVSTNLNANTDVTLQLAWKNQFQFAGYYIAKEKGFYKDAGLNVNIKEFDNDVNITDDVINGKVDFGIGRSSLISDRYNDKPVVMLAAIFQHSPVILLAKKRDDITRLEDLKNKNIMLTTDQVAMASINAMLQTHKVTPKMYTTQLHSFNVQDLIDGKTDVMLSYISNEPYIMQQQNIPYTVFAPKDYNFDFYSDILFTSEDLVKKKPQVVKDFREATLKGWEYALKHKEETVQLILKKYNTQHKTKDSLLYEANAIDKLINTKEIELGDIDSKRVEYITQIYSLMGLINTQKPIENLIYKVEKTFENNNLELTQEEKKYLELNPYILVGGEMDWEPFDFVDKKGNYLGISKDIIDLVAKKVGLEIEYKTGQTWKELVTDFKKSKIDILPAIYKNKDREDYTLFTNSYFKIKDYAFVRSDDNTINSINDLKSKRVAVIEGYAIEKNLKQKFPNIKFIKVRNKKEGIDAVLLNHADVYIDGYAIVMYTLSSQFISGIKPVIPIDFYSNDLHIGITKSKPILASIIKKGLDSITTIEKNTILNKWLLSANSNIKSSTTEEKSVQLSIEEKAWLEKHPNILLGADENWQPFDFKDKLGSHDGFNADFINLIKKKLGINIETELGVWGELQDKVKNKKLSGLVGVYKNDERDKYMNFTNPYFVLAQVVLIQKDGLAITSLNDLDGKTLGLKSGGSDIEYFKTKYPNIKQKIYESNLEVIRAVSSGEVDAGASNIGAASYEMERNFISNIKVGYEITNLSGDMRIGIRKDWPELGSILQKGMDAITPEEIEVILQKWLKLASNNKEVSYNLNLTQAEKDWIKKKISIRYVYDPDWAPFEWKNELGHHTGIVADVINIIAERSGINFEALDTDSWESSKQKVQDKDADMYSAINESEEIFKYMDFTNKNLFDVPFAFVTRTNDTSDYFNVFDALEGKKIAVVKDYPIEDMIRNDRSDIDLITVQNMTEGFQKLRDGDIDVFCQDIVTAKRFINVEGFDDLRIAVKTNYTFNLKIAIRDDWPKEVIAIINKTMDTITKKEIDDIYNQWTNITYKETVDYSLIWKILAGVLVVILLFIYYNRKLKILVNEKTNELQEVLKSLEVKVEMRTEELNNQKEFVQTLLDSQEQIVVTTKKNSIISVNKAFLKFYNITSIKEFVEQYNVECICDTFHADAPSGYLQKFMEDENWIDYIIKRADLDMTHKVQIVREDIHYIFSVTAAILPGNQGLKSAVFTNITEIERAKQEVEAIHKHTRESIEYASLIQGALIPDNQIFQNFFQDHFAIWNPKDIVGGDIYLMNEINEDELILMVIDCTGHGVPGAFVTMLVKAIERQLMANLHRDKTISPAKILSIFNRSIKNLLKQESIDSVSNAGFDGGIIYYNKKEKIVKFSGAETYLFYIDENREFQTIKGSRHSIGYKKSDANFEFKEHLINVNEGMQFYCSTDGYLDQNGGEKGFPFGKKQFSRIIKENHQKPLEEQKEILIEELNNYQKEEERNDDVTLIGFKV